MDNFRVALLSAIGGALLVGGGTALLNRPSANLVPVAQPAPLMAPAATRAVAPNQQRFAPAPQRAVASAPARAAVAAAPKKRSVKKSAVIIGASAGTGAAIGAIAGGGRGAAIGAISGGAAGVVYDQITRNKK